MLNPAWRSPKGGGSADSWPWKAFKAPYPAPGNILPQPSEGLTCPGRATQQVQRQPVVLLQQLCLLETLHNKKPRMAERVGFHPLVHQTLPSTNQRTRAENISSGTSPTSWRWLGLSQEPVLSQQHREEQRG